MAADSLAALGMELRAEAATWLAEVTPAALPEGTEAARELLATLGALEADVARAAVDEVELTRLQAWLTAGFHAAAEPYAPAEPEAAEAAEAARRGERGPGADARERATAAPGARERVAENAGKAPSRSPGNQLPDPGEPRHRRFGGDAAAGEDRRPSADRAGAPPRPGGGIQGLAALAGLAGRGGVAIPVPREDADRLAREDAEGPGEQPGRVSAPTGRDPDAGGGPWPAEGVDAAHPQPRGERRDASSAARLVEPDAARGVDRDTRTPPPRIIRTPSTPPLPEDADAARSAGPPPPIPFLASPGVAEADGMDGPPAAPGPDARTPAAIPAMRLFEAAAGEPAVAPDTARLAKAEWGDVVAPRERVEPFLARAARLAGPRARPAEVVGGGAPGPPAGTPPAVPPPASASAGGLGPEPAAPERDGDAPGRTGAEWPAPDVTELMDALASEIEHEYRRYYGE